MVARMVASSTASADSNARSASPASGYSQRRRSKLLGAPTSIALASVATLGAGA
jgi:hypothetical protein